MVWLLHTLIIKSEYHDFFVCKFIGSTKDDWSDHKLIVYHWLQRLLFLIIIQLFPVERKEIVKLPIFSFLRSIVIWGCKLIGVDGSKR